jgi:hypothetical protein
VSRRFLTHAKTATKSEWSRLRREVNDAIYETDPGFMLLHWAIDDPQRSGFVDIDEINRLSANARSNFFRVWGRRDMKSAFDAALHAEPASQRMSMLSYALSGSSKDPELALALVRSIADPVLRQNVAYSAATSAAAKDPEKCHELAAEFPIYAESIYTEAFRAMARENPQNALAKIDGIPSQFRDEARKALLHGWASEDFDAAEIWARENDTILPQQAYQSWVSKDPIRVISAANANGFDSSYSNVMIFRGNMGDGKIISLVKQAESSGKGEAVASWLPTINDASLRARLTSGLMQSQNDAGEAVLEAVRFAVGHPDADSTYLDTFASRIRDDQLRRDWKQSLLVPVARKQMAQEATAWFNDRPREFAEYVESIPEGRAQAAFVDEAISKSNAGDSLVQWVKAHLPEETLRRLTALKK